MYISVFFWIMLCTLACSELVAQSVAQSEQVILSNTGSAHKSASTSLDKTSCFERTYTFDDIELTHAVNQTILSHDCLSFFHFEVLNVTASSNKGWLHPNDTDSATSPPNVLHSSPTKYVSSSIIRSNATALAAQNLSPYFDLISFTTKPRGPVPKNSGVSLELWRVDGRAKFMHGLWIQWPAEGYLWPVKAKPSNLWPGWGEGVNWIEMKGFSAVENDRGAYREAGREFFVDDITVRFYELEASE